MQEEFLQYLFEYGLIENTEFEIISSGIKNTDAGPDFFNSKIKIDDTIWAGNVEIHIKSSDWKRHNHHKDKAYDNIILHLVLIHDTEILTTKGVIIPTFEIKYKQEIFDTYESLIYNKLWVHCENDLSKIDSFTKSSYIDSLAIDRLMRKSLFFNQLLEYNNNNWEESFYQALAKGFGGKINQIPFELLAKSVSLKHLAKAKGNILEIEAILFGQAGLLEKEADDIYYQNLQQEYRFQRKKLKLENIRTELWKFSKVRPYNFPTLRIALFAQLINTRQSLLSIISECKTINDIENVLEVKASEYWETHYRFSENSKTLNKKLGKASKQHLIINTIIPFLYIYAEQTHQENLKERCLDWLSNLPKEDNNITRKWELLKFENANAMQSQGLIELKNEVCAKHRCIDCRIGHKILTLA